MKTNRGVTSANNRASRLFGSVAITALLAVAPLATAHADAAAGATDAYSANEVTAVVVTGTSIRGAAPVGDSVTVVNAAAIEKTGAQTVQDVLKSVPAVVVFFFAHLLFVHTRSPQHSVLDLHVPLSLVQGFLHCP